MCNVKQQMDKTINYHNIKLDSHFAGDNEKINAKGDKNIAFTQNVEDDYFLSKNVFWIKGAINSVLHDFNLNVIYWLNHDTSLFLNEVLNSRIPHTNQAQNALLLFLNAGVITTDKQNSSDENIESIFVKKEKIKLCFVELTQKCNLKCKHCYNEVLSRSVQSLSYKDLIKVIDELVEYGIEILQFIGGEPLLFDHSDFLKVLDFATPQFEKITIFSNGTLLTEDYVKEISKYPNVDFSVALYSFVEKEHDCFTGVKGSFRNTMNSIELLKNNNIPTRCTGILADGVEIGENNELVNDYRLDFVRLSGRGSLGLYNKQLLKARLKTLESMDYEWTKENVVALYNERCFSRLLYISSNLDVFPCAMERRLKHGNLKHDKLSNIIKKSILNFSKKDIDGCKDCEFRYICVGCPPDSLNGSLNEKPWNCTYDVYSGKWLDVDDCIERILSYDGNNESFSPSSGGCRTGVL